MGGDSGTMSSSYAGSVASSRQSAARRPRIDQEADGQGADLVESRSSLENGIFGVLFTLSKENDEMRIRKRWVMLKIMLDAWQLFTTVVNPGRQGWAINPDGLPWTIIGVLNFTWLGDLGYNWYLAVLYSMLGLLAINVAMCVWVAWCFKEHKFPVVWPIKALRLISKVFFQAFDVACLNLLQLGISCRYNGPITPHMVLDLFPEYSCKELPHIAHAIVSAMCLLLFVLIALLINMAEVEVNLLSNRPSALGHSGAEVMAFAIKVMITLVGVFIGWMKVAAVLELGLAIFFAYQYLRWSPHLVAWANHMKSGVGIGLVWVCGMLVLLVFQPGGLTNWDSIITITMLAGLLPAFGLGAAWSRYRIRKLTRTALRALAEAGPEMRLKDICKNIDDPRDVEVIARCCRVWRDEYTLDPEAVNKAKQVIQAGVAMFPNSAYMVLLHGNFMIGVLGITQSGGRRIDDARKLDPSLICRFIMFIRQQEATQSAASSVANRGAAGMDLLAYVEYQRKQRTVIGLHREALQAMCNFWKALDGSRVSFVHLSKALGMIESSVSQAQAAYRAVLELYNQDPKLVRLYGKFLQTIKNDPWRAAEYFAEAERLEEIKSGNEGGPLLPDGTPLGRMDELDSAVLVITSNGSVQMANRYAYSMFGYRRGMLETKHVTNLLASHYARRVSDKLAALVNATALTSAAECRTAVTFHNELVVGMHADRVAFQLKMSVQKASGVGEDSTFIVIMDAVTPLPGVTTLWVAGNGTVVACDPQFISLFGWKATDVTGMSLATLVKSRRLRNRRMSTGALDVDMGQEGILETNETASDMIKRILDNALNTALSLDEHPPDEGMRVFVTHKYDSEQVVCSLTVWERDTSETPVHELRLKITAADPSQLLVVNRKGVVLHASPELIKVLKDTDKVLKGGHGGGERGGTAAVNEAALNGLQLVGDPLAGFTLPDFLPSPWRDMHMKLLKSTTALSPPPRNPSSCRKSSPGPILEMRTASGKRVFMRVSVTTSDTSGELTHAVRMKRLTLDSAIAERRLRLAIKSDGHIFAVGEGTPPQLFGIEYGQLVGHPLWSLIDWSSHSESGVLPDSGHEMFTTLVKRAVTQPGESWRVLMTPPSEASTAPKDAVDEVFAAARATLSKQCVMQVIVELPAADGANFNQSPQIFVDLWPLPSITGVLELDPLGRIRSVLEERVRPAGLLFGVKSEALVGSLFSQWVEMPLGRSRPGELLTLNAFKKSSLKTVSQEASIKIGPVHVLKGVHADGNQLSLDIQVIGKPGPGQVTHAILRYTLTPMLNSRGPSRMPSMLPNRAAGGPPGGPRPAALEARLMSFAARQKKDTEAAEEAAGAHITREGGARRDGRRLEGPLAAEPRTPPPRRPSSVDPVSTPPAKSSDKMPVGHSISFDNTDGELAVRGSGSSGSGDAGGAVADAVLTLKAVATVGSQLPPPPSPAAVLENVGTGVPVPGVTTSRPPMTPNAGRSKLADLVKSVEDHRSSSGGGGTGDGARRMSTLGSDQLRLSQPLAASPLSPVVSTDRLGGERRAAFSPVGRPRGSGKASGLGLGHEPGSRLSLMVPSPGITTAAGADGGEQDDGLLSPGTKAVLRTQPSLVKDADMMSAGGSSDEEGGKVIEKVHLGKDRISKWVASEGAFYQNSTPPRSHKDDDDDDDEDDGAGKATGAKPGAKSIDLKAVLRGGSAAKIDSPGAQGGQSGADGRPPSAPGSVGRKDHAPYMEDDAASEGGQSAMSAQSGSGEAEYKRGKRFRKLIKLMDSSKTQQVQRRFWIHALITVAVLAVIHIVCFVATVITIEGEKRAMLQLSRAGQSQRYLHQILIDTRALDVIIRNRTEPNLYTAANATQFIDRIASNADEFQIRMKEIMDAHQASDSAVQEIFQYTFRTVWGGLYPNGTDKSQNMTIWDFATLFYVCTKTIEQDAPDWVKQGVPISSTTPGMFILKSGPDLWRATRLILDALLYEAVDYAKLVDTLQIVFLTTEGFAISCLAACYLAWLLRALAAQRYKLYSTFLVIPVGLTRALASQNTNLVISDNDDDDDDDDELENAERAGSAASHDGDEEEDEGLPNTPKLKRRATLKVTEPEEVGLGGGRGSKLIPGRSGNSVTSANSEAGPADVRRSSSLRLATNHRTLTSESLETGQVGCWGQFKWRIRRLFTRRSRAVTPLPGKTQTDLSGLTKRKLKYDSHETLLVMLPFILWSILVIAIYAVAVVEVKGITDVVAVHSVANFMAARTLRMVYFTQELAVVDDTSQLATRRASLASVVKGLKDSWYTLKMGSNAYRALGNATERFPLVQEGLTYSTPAITNIVYGNGVCHRTENNLPCPGPEYRYHTIIFSSLDSIMQLLLLLVTDLATDETSNLVGLDAFSVDMIYNIGTVDLLDGVIQIQGLHYDHIIGLFRNILVLHIILFLMFWVIFSGFFFILLHPLLRRVTRERRRIAELMSQLPLELDVVKLVARALGAIKSSPQGPQGLSGVPHGGPGAGGAAAAGGEAATGQGDADGADAFSKWKAIIRMSSNQAKAVLSAPEGSVKGRKL